MKTPWTDENAWAEEDHGDFWVPQKRFPRRVKGHLWFVALAAASAVVWIAIHAAGASYVAFCRSPGTDGNQLD
jgi:hypothetical protein